MHLLRITTFHTTSRLYNPTPASSSSSSLRLQTCKYGLDFRRDRCPFSSVQNSCSQSFYTYVVYSSKSNSTSIIHPHYSRSSSFSSSLWVAFQQRLYCLSAIPSYNMPKSFQYAYFNYGYDIWILKLIINFFIFILQ